VADAQDPDAAALDISLAAVLKLLARVDQLQAVASRRQLENDGLRERLHVQEALQHTRLLQQAQERAVQDLTALSGTMHTAATAMDSFLGDFQQVLSTSLTAGVATAAAAAVP
jgi:hypothetical protein